METRRKKKNLTPESSLSTIYQSCFQHTSDLVYLIDKDCRLLDINANFLNNLSTTQIDKATIGSIYKLMQAAHYWKEDQLQTMKARDIETILSAEEHLLEPALPRIDAEGTIHQHLISRIPLIEAGSVVALLVIIKDITEQMALKEQLTLIQEELSKSNANTKALQSALPINSTRPLQLLLVEDNLTAQKAAQALLMQMDCKVDAANSEAQMLSYFAPGKYDMIFMDIGLDNTSGYMLTKQIRSLEKNTDYHVPIIALTSYDADMITEDCLYYDMQGAITKPLTIEQTKQLIQRFILHIDLPVTGIK